MNSSEQSINRLGDPTFFLEGVVHEKSDMVDFEGPLSLILLLLSKNKIEIRDIPIAICSISRRGCCSRRRRRSPSWNS